MASPSEKMVVGAQMAQAFLGPKLLGEIQAKTVRETTKTLDCLFNDNSAMTCRVKLARSILQRLAFLATQTRLLRSKSAQY